MIWVEIGILIISLTILIICSNYLVDATSSLASNFNVSKLIIALTIVAFGTCAPELAISFNSMASGNGDMAIANVIGSNVVNILLIIGLAASIYPIKIKNDIIKKEIPYVVAITCVFASQMINNFFIAETNVVLTRINSIALVIIFALFLKYIFTSVKTKKSPLDFSQPEYSFMASLIITLVCILGIIVSSDLVVKTATDIAETINISKKLITMTVIVIGTSLPELTLTVIAAKKKEFEIAVGNIIGTNIFNIGIVLALPTLIYGNVSSTNFNIIDVTALVLGSLAFYFFAKTDRKLKRYEGIVMILIFAAYYLYLFIQ